MKKLFLIGLLITSIYAKYTVCKMYLQHGVTIVCFDGEEYFSTGFFNSAGITKTGHNCKCIKEAFGYKVVRIKKKEK